jgi:hypothetical protein
LYNPNQDAHKVIAPENNFAASKATRTLFEPINRRENDLPPRDLPGPGKYDPKE